MPNWRRTADSRPRGDDDVVDRPLPEFYACPSPRLFLLSLRMTSNSSSVTSGLVRTSAEYTARTLAIIRISARRAGIDLHVRLTGYDELADALARHPQQLERIGN